MDVSIGHGRYMTLVECCMPGWCASCYNTCFLATHDLSWEHTMQVCLGIGIMKGHYNTAHKNSKYCTAPNIVGAVE